MKKLFIGLVTLAFVFTSCTKEHTCTCTTDNPLGGDPIVTSTIIDATKSDAEAVCETSSSVVGVDCVLE